MPSLDLTLSGCSIPTGTSASIIVYEDTDGDGVAENQDTVSLSDGVTSYTTADVFEAGSGDDYWLEFNLDNSDVTVASEITVDATLSGLAQEISAPVTSLTTSTPSPSVTPAPVTVDTPVTTLTTQTPSPSVTPGSVSVSPDTTTLGLTTPSPGVFGPPTNLTATSTADGQSVDLAWSDAGAEDGYRVERQQPGVTSWSVVADLGADTVAYSDSGVIPGKSYEYRVEAYQDGGLTTLSGVVAVSTPGGGQQPRVSSSGWSVSITHPISGRVIHPSVINPQSVQYIPGPNTLPRVRLPTRVNASWLDEEFDANPTMTVHLDGEQLPIGELVDVEHNEGETILIGEGGPELRQRVSVEYTSEERPTAASDLVTNNTSYSVVDNTTAAPSDTVDAQNPSGETELMGAITLAASDPLVFTGGGIKPAQTCFTTEGEGFDSGSDAGVGGIDGSYSGGVAATFEGTSGDVTYNFTTQHVIPESDLEVWFRFESPVGSGPEIEASIDGTLFSTITSGEFSVLGWENSDTSSGITRNWTGGDLPAGSHTLRLNATGGGTDFHAIDVVAPLDGRYTYNFDNTVNTTDGYLDGPELYPPAVDAVFDSYESAFSITDGSVSVTMNDTSNDQALALSNDRGATYDITGSNTTSISGSFVDAGATINLKASLAHYEPSGTRDATPRTGYDAQRLDAYDLDATIETVSLLIDQEYNNSIDKILNQVLGEQYGWKYSIENGTKTVTLDEPGSTTADRDPKLTESQIRKQLKTYKKVIIQGSSLPVSGEVFNASTSFVNLTEDNIQTGSEAVYDSSGTQYHRGVDYEMDYSNGQIKILSGGSLSSGTDYSIDYRHQVKGSHTVSGATGEELVRTIPGVVSDRQAEQIAYVLAEVYPGVATPRYEGRIVVPRLDVSFDPLEGLELADLDLPSVATPLSIRGEPELTPLGLTLSLGSAPRLEESLRAISQQVSSLSDRV